MFIRVFNEQEETVLLNSEYIKYIWDSRYEAMCKIVTEDGRVYRTPATMKALEEKLNTTP